MRNAKRFCSLLLSLILTLSLMSIGAAAAENETISDVTLIVSPMDAGERVGADVIAVPEGAQYEVHASHLRLLPFAGAEDALVTYYIQTTTPALENGHVYMLEFWFRADSGSKLGETLNITVQDTGTARYSKLDWDRYTDESGVETVMGQLTYVVGTAPAVQTVTALAMTANGSMAPEVGKPLASRLTLQATPANGVYEREATVSWITAAPGAAPEAASGAVKAGQAYYTPSFLIRVNEGYRFSPGVTLTLDGAKLPDSMQRLLDRGSTYSHIASRAFSYYGIAVQPAEHGTATAPDYAAGGSPVQLTATPDEGYELAGWTAKDQRGLPLEITADNAFLMPDPIPEAAETPQLQRVSVTPLFRPKEAPKPVNPFTDVAEGQYYYDPVLWAVNHEPQITKGTSDTLFSPGATCTRGQVVTFLWRTAGEPTPKTAANPFTDVKANDYFYQAVLWAVEEGITKGTSATTFSPGDPCTRAHVVTFLWRAQQEPAAGSSNPFRDVPAGQYYTDAVLWAVVKGVTNGTSATTFSPNDPCTRGQIVTFLYRAQG